MALKHVSRRVGLRMESKYQLGLSPKSCRILISTLLVYVFYKSVAMWLSDLTIQRMYCDIEALLF